MPVAKVAVTIDRALLELVDEWVRLGKFPNRSRAVQAGLDRLRHDQQRRGSLLEQLARLDSEEERAITEEWLPSEASWPEY